MSNKNDDFNFEEFSVAAIKSIDSTRSSFSFGTPDELKNGANAEPKESRINAFYRSLGLPAVWPPRTFTAKQEARYFRGGTRPDERNNGNIHLISFNQFENDLNRRQYSYVLPPTEQEITTFMDVNKKNPSDSISRGKRLRGDLFPMVVDGRIWVRPKSRRVAGAFMDLKDRRDGDLVYNRPLIEIILHMRLKGDNVTDSGKQEDISLAFQVDSLKKMGETAGDRFDKSLNVISSVLSETQLKCQRSRNEIGIEIIPEISNIAQQNPKTRVNPSKKGQLDELRDFIEYENLIKHTILSLWEYDDTNSKNILDSCVGNLLVDILAPTIETTTSKKEKETDRRAEKMKTEAKSAYRSLDLLLGTYSGISGVDIIVILAAMFEIETKYLIALLNDKAKDRLKIIKGDSVVGEANGIEVSTAITELQTKVEQIMGKVSSDLSTRKHDQKSQNKSDVNDETA